MPDELKKPLTDKEIKEYRDARASEGKPLTREDMLKLHEKRIELEEEVEEVKKRLDTHLTADELKEKLRRLRAKDALIEAELLISESPEFHELKKDLDECVEVVKAVTAEYAKAVEDHFKIDTKYSDQIRKLEEQLRDIKDKRSHEISSYEDNIINVRRRKESCTERLRESAKKLTDFCNSKGVNPQPHLKTVVELDHPTSKTTRLTLDRSLVRPSYPLAWFTADKQWAWKEWKRFVSERGVRILHDKSGVSPEKVLRGLEAKRALSLCKVEISDDLRPLEAP